MPNRNRNRDDVHSVLREGGIENHGCSERSSCSVARCTIPWIELWEHEDRELLALRSFGSMQSDPLQQERTLGWLCGTRTWTHGTHG